MTVAMTQRAEAEPRDAGPATRRRPPTGRPSDRRPPLRHAQRRRRGQNARTGGQRIGVPVPLVAARLGAATLGVVGPLGRASADWRGPARMHRLAQNPLLCLLMRAAPSRTVVQGRLSQAAGCRTRHPEGSTWTAPPTTTHTRRAGPDSLRRSESGQAVRVRSGGPSLRGLAPSPSTRLRGPGHAGTNRGRGFH